MGGFGSAVLEAFHQQGWDASGLRVHAIPDRFIEHSPQTAQRAALKLDAAGVLETVFELYPDLARPAASRRADSAADENERQVAEPVTW